MTTTHRFGWLQRMADNIAALMLAAMFIIFVAQILSRYLLNLPLGWAEEVLLTLWLWLIFWASAFCLKEQDHIRFDILYQAAPPARQRIFFLIAALGVVLAFLTSLPATWDYITFYKIKKSAILKIRLDYVFSIYGVFVLAVVLSYLWKIIQHLHPGLYQRLLDAQQTNNREEAP
ncbi:MAG: TRAP transporter small permease subunit [Thiolinea sp.]